MNTKELIDTLRSDLDCIEFDHRPYVVAIAVADDACIDDSVDISPSMLLAGAKDVGEYMDTHAEQVECMLDKAEFYGAPYEELRLSYTEAFELMRGIIKKADKKETTERNIDIYEHNVVILKNRRYYIGRRKIDLSDDIKRMTYNTEWRKTNERYAQPMANGHSLKTGVMWTDTITAVRRMIAEHGENQVMALNMANAYHACGGYHKGSTAQEESLCRQTTLSASLQDMVSKDVYPLDIRHGRIVSPNVTVFRDIDGKLLEHPFNVDIVSVAALNFNKSMTHNNLEYMDMLKDGVYHPMTSEGFDIMVGKVHAILDSAIEHGDTALVLGAFGCGAFMMNVDEVASVFRSVIDNCPKYKGAFKAIVFAIMTEDEDKFRPFVDKFGLY